MGVNPANGPMDLVLGLGALITLISLVRSWRSFVDDEFTLPDRHLALQISVFLVPPAVVLLHELGHYAAALAVGARVVDFHYGLFEGSVEVVGALTPAQNWLVAVAGTVVSAAVGLAMVAAGGLGGRIRRPFRYVLIVGGLLEVAFALIGYPLLSESARFGDWLAIYDFAATPVLGWATLLVHATVLFLMWRWWKGGLRQTLFGVTHAEERRLAELQEAVRRAPADVDARLALANLFAGYGDLSLAAAPLDAGVGVVGSGNPSDVARLHLARARLAIFRGNWNQALLATREGLAAGGDQRLQQLLWANQGVALSQMERPGLALEAFGHVDESLLADPRLRYCRAVSRLAVGDLEGGRSDLRAVVDALPPGDLLRRWAEARLAGHLLAADDDDDGPAHQRRRQAPRAPIAGV